MTVGGDADEAAEPDLAAYRTSNLADPELAAAYEVENEGIRLDGTTYGYAFLLAIIPVSLVLLMLSMLLGDWVWTAFPILFVCGGLGLALVRSGLIHRYRSDLPIVLPGHGTFTGEAKKRLLRKAIAVFVLAGLYVLARDAGLFTRLREWFMEWMIPL